MTYITITDPKETITAWMFGFAETTSDRAGHAGLKKDYELIKEYVIDSIKTYTCANFSLETNLSNTQITDTHACAQELIYETNKLLIKLSEIITIPKYITSFINDSILNLEKLYTEGYKEVPSMVIEVVFESYDESQNNYEETIGISIDVLLYIEDDDNNIITGDEIILASSQVKFISNITLTD